MTVRAQLLASLSMFEETTNVMGNPQASGAMDISMSFGDGVTLGNFNRPYIAEREVASNTNDDIDLTALLSQLGTAFSAVELAGIMIINRRKDGTANTTALTLGGGSNPVLGLFSSTVLQPGAFAMIAGPSASGIAAVTADTGDILRVANASGALNKYMIGLLGRSS